MEKDIIKALDSLTVEQTERLTGENMEMKISGRERRRIKNSVFEKIGVKKQKGFSRTKRPTVFAATLAAFAITFAVAYGVGFDNVAAAFKNIFTFVPGIGIQVKSQDTIYTAAPIVGQTEAQGAKASIVSASYSDGYLNATVEVIGKAVYSEGFSIYLNQNPLKLEDELFKYGYGLSVSTDSTMLNFSYETDAPTDGDVYEIAIDGFSQRLSFKMNPCNSYEDVREIGPTDIQNGISVTAVTQRVDGQLIVWCYPLKTDGAVKDTILGYGQPANGSFDVQKYIETKSGKIFSSSSGWVIRGREVFDFPDDVQSATLHIPYLSMLRNEKKKLKVSLPEGYGTVESGVSIECSLGTIRVTEVKRQPNEYEDGKDTVMIKFEFDSNDDRMVLSSFNFDLSGKYSSSAMCYNGETGCLEYLEVYVGENDKNISLSITDLYYYLLGEYVIPLDVY